MRIDMSRFHDTFFEESAEHLETMETGLLELDGGQDDPDLMNRIFRAAHSIKGGSGSFGFSEIARFTHVLENVLDRLRDGSIAVTAGTTDTLLRSTDTLKALVSATRSGDPATVPMDGPLAELEAIRGQPAGPGEDTPAPVSPSEGDDAGGPTTYRIDLTPHEAFLHQGQDALLLLRELGGLGEMLEMACDTTHIPALADLHPQACYLRWTMRLRTAESESDIRDVFMFVDDACDLTIVPDRPGQAEADDHPNRRTGEDRRKADRRVGSREGASIRVATEKIDTLIDMVGELVIAQAMVTQAASDADLVESARMREVLEAVERNTREVQDGIMAIRMLPIGTVFSRFPRLVRDLAGKLDKRMALEASGVETELDKGVIERLSDPLTHLIRNAIDHGIEPPAERVAAGKAEQGTVSLKAFHEGGNVIIEVGDDGRGLNREAILRKAMVKGVAQREEDLSDDEIYQFIFRAGFSTATEVSDISGRGVGMDVVRRNVDELNGSITVSSTPGRGTCFRIRLPLTLAILDGLTVKVGAGVFVIPLLSIVESLRPGPEDLRLIMGKGELLTVREDTIPLVRLTRVFGLAHGVTDPCLGIVVILENDGTRFGVLVDDLLGQSQVVIKNLEANYQKVDAVMGATILGDGRIALILDVQELQRQASRAATPMADMPAAVRVGFDDEGTTP